MGVIAPRIVIDEKSGKTVGDVLSKLPKLLNVKDFPGKFLINTACWNDVLFRARRCILC